jgi:hypothetical protein
MSLRLEGVERFCSGMSIAKKRGVLRIICRLDGTVPKYRRELKVLVVIRDAYLVKCL